MPEPFWLNSPSILFHENRITKIWPTPEMTIDEKLNAITRLVIILTLLGFLLTKTSKIIVTGLVTLIAIVILRKVSFTNKAKQEIKNKGMEAFTNPELYDMVQDSFTKSTETNPFMNPLLTDDPKRKPAAPSFNSTVDKKINRNTTRFITESSGVHDADIKCLSDLGDNFQFNNSMRNWYTMPNTQVPNNQDAFAKFCYGNMTSCKEQYDENNVDLQCG